ncbi:MAG TPA: tRNA (guanosine(37)-N1)-methyltransferase TrmD [Mycobacteriales bacterium]|nr:tRNA (guanosine(37)-N1)-methyltransferase TrmD [Mycobacteriales bacterium]
MRVDVVTIFPEFFGPLDVSLLGKARERGLVDVRVHDLRKQTSDVHRTVDDAPFGGGPGMVMKPEPWYAAFEEILAGGGPAERPRVVVPTPSGRLLTQALVEELAAEPWLAIACGRYEGIDRRVVDRWADDEVSLGDYVLAGGEVAALVLVEAVTRLLPGVVGNAESVADDSHTTGLLEGPVYTRPASYDGREVPAVLLSGDHGAIARWRRDEALRRTAALRPELLARAGLDARDRAVLAELDLPFPLPPPAVAD